MKIYTKTGDKGETGLWGAKRVPKDHPRIQAYGTVDELNACLGIFLSEKDLPESLRARISRIQGELFHLGSELATPSGVKLPIALIGTREIEHLEKEIDEMEKTLPALKNFILPTGTRASALLQVARTISRRVEREMLPAHRSETLRDEILQYMNRLSDYLFVAARYCNHEQGGGEAPWVPFT